MEVPRIEVELELQLMAHATATTTPDLSCIPISHNNARSLTHWAGPGIETVSSWILVRFIATEPNGEVYVQIFVCQWKDRERREKEERKNRDERKWGGEKMKRNKEAANRGGQLFPLNCYVLSSLNLTITLWGKN